MIRFSLNGKPQRFRGPPFRRLIDVLREDLRLTGTKEGCGEGECGACTVLLDGAPVCSCLIPIGQMAGRRVETIEALGSPETLDNLQSCFLEYGGSQCGICTPGMVLTAWAWIRDGGSDDAQAIRQQLAGNLCRCTGYAHIVDSVVAAIRQLADGRAARRKKTASKRRRKS